MSTFALAPHLSFCWIDGEAVFLDADRNRYFRLTGPANAALLGLTRQSAASGRGLKTLVERGIVIAPARGPGLVAPTEIAVPGRSLAEEINMSACGLTAAIEISWDVGRISRDLRRERLARILRWVAATGPSRRGTGPLERPLARFLGARRLVPATPTCLLDSLALFRFLARRGHRPTLVFGVRLDPFAAHCWLQTREAVLNDPAEHASAFTPILAI